MEISAKKVSGFQLFIIFVKNSILDVKQYSEYACLYSAKTVAGSINHLELPQVSCGLNSLTEKASRGCGGIPVDYDFNVHNTDVERKVKFMILNILY